MVAAEASLITMDIVMIAIIIGVRTRTTEVMVTYTTMAVAPITVVIRSMGGIHLTIKFVTPMEI